MEKEEFLQRISNDVDYKNSVISNYRSFSKGISLLIFALFLVKFSIFCQWIIKGGKISVPYISILLLIMASLAFLLSKNKEERIILAVGSSKEMIGFLGNGRKGIVKYLFLLFLIFGSVIGIVFTYAILSK